MAVPLKVSGYTSEEAGDDGNAISSRCFLQKPFRNQDLVRRIAEVLDAPAQP
ncbi:MAG: hypothetical protein ACHRHE_08280 [Tepidisphaerales bacterium]